MAASDGVRVVRGAYGGGGVIGEINKRNRIKLRKKAWGAQVKPGPELDAAKGVEF